MALVRTEDNVPLFSAQSNRVFALLDNITIYGIVVDSFDKVQ